MICPTVPRPTHHLSSPVEFNISNKLTILRDFLFSRDRERGENQPETAAVERTGGGQRYYDEM